MSCLGARASRPHRYCGRRCNRDGRAPSLPRLREGSRGAVQHEFLGQVILTFCPACGMASPLPTRRTQCAGRHEDVVRMATEQASPASMKHKYVHGYRHWHMLVSHRRRRPFCGRLLLAAPGCSVLLQAVQGTEAPSACRVCGKRRSANRLPEQPTSRRHAAVCIGVAPTPVAASRRLRRTLSRRRPCA
jgi:hypothetical protein